MITITVNGPRAEGSTTTAMRITQMLRSLGFEAEYRGPDAARTACIEELLRDDRRVFDRATEPRQFLVLDVGGPLVD